MTSKIFEDYIRHLNKKMQQQQRKVALVLDNCPAHPHFQLDNVKLVYLPPNATSATQPLDAGIIRCVKTFYRAELARKRLFSFENNVEQFDVNVLDAMWMLSRAWEKVSG